MLFCNRIPMLYTHICIWNVISMRKVFFPLHRLCFSLCCHHSLFTTIDNANANLLFDNMYCWSEKRWNAIATTTYDKKKSKHFCNIKLRTHLLHKNIVWTRILLYYRSICRWNGSQNILLMLLYKRYRKVKWTGKILKWNLKCSLISYNIEFWTVSAIVMNTNHFLFAK